MDCFEDVIALHQISHLTILPIDGELQKRAVQLSQKYQLLSHDALHTACCEKMEIDHIATLDGDFERVDFLTVWTPEEKTNDEPSET